MQYVVYCIQNIKRILTFEQRIDGAIIVYVVWMYLVHVCYFKHHQCKLDLYFLIRKFCLRFFFLFKSLVFVVFVHVFFTKLNQLFEHCILHTFFKTMRLNIGEDGNCYFSSFFFLAFLTPKNMYRTQITWFLRFCNGFEILCHTHKILFYIIILKRTQ